MDQAHTITLASLTLGLIIILCIIASRGLMRKSIENMIKLFEDRQAVGIENARSLIDLGFAERSHVIFIRDYKALAFRFLLRKDIIRVTNDGKFYLSKYELFLFNGTYIRW
jgi:hypothetical protein